MIWKTVTLGSVGGFLRFGMLAACQSDQAETRSEKFKLPPLPFALTFAVFCPPFSGLCEARWVVFVLSCSIYPTSKT